ncbi:MAG TPA: hypothetical protein VL860_11000 [Planctomycetota bacterium]|nr:hypothetical protein [Planctomycetota bacterium]
MCLWEYEAAGRDLVLTFKFGGQRNLAILLGRWLYAVARERELFQGAKWLAPAPGSQQLSALVADENHAIQLARAIAAADAAAARPIGLRVLPQALAKVRATTPQALLPLAKRLAEPANSMVYSANVSIQGECVILIDDVLTTLATATEAARALTAAGAREVRLLALARTL